MYIHNLYLKANVYTQPISKSLSNRSGYYHTDDIERLPKTLLQTLYVQLWIHTQQSNKAEKVEPDIENILGKCFFFFP